MEVQEQIPLEIRARVEANALFDAVRRRKLGAAAKEDEPLEVGLAHHPRSPEIAAEAAGGGPMTRLHLPTPSAPATSPPVAPIPHGIEPSLTMSDVCKVRSVSRRTGERERSAGLWPKPDFFAGTGTRKSPRWRPSTIRSWIEAKKIETPWNLSPRVLPRDLLRHLTTCRPCQRTPSHSRVTEDTLMIQRPPAQINAPEGLSSSASNTPTRHLTIYSPHSDAAPPIASAPAAARLRTLGYDVADVGDVGISLVPVRRGGQP